MGYPYNIKHFKTTACDLALIKQRWTELIIKLVSNCSAWSMCLEKSFLEHLLDKIV